MVSKSKGQKEDNRGKVEFIADYFWDGEVQQLHEHSRFRTARNLLLAERP
ncbi:YchJ family metal-binding protein [bacterium]|nr:YchJ family metal-binding protein [bacterium]MDC0272736.1 YchJ family metal-binding protein [bacterium]